MIELHNIQPTDSGFYFMNYFDCDEIRLHTLQINSKNEIISKKSKGKKARPSKKVSKRRVSKR